MFRLPDCLVHSNRAKVKTGSGADPPRQASQNIGYSPVQFPGSDEPKYIKQSIQSSERLSSSAPRWQSDACRVSWKFYPMMFLSDRRQIDSSNIQRNHFTTIIHQTLSTIASAPFVTLTHMINKTCRPLGTHSSKRLTPNPLKYLTDLTISIECDRCRLSLEAEVGNSL